MNKSAHSYIGCLILLTLIAGTTFYMNIPSLGLPEQQEFIVEEAMELSSVVVYALWVVCIVASNFISCWAHNHTENGGVSGSVEDVIPRESGLPHYFMGEWKSIQAYLVAFATGNVHSATDCLIGHLGDPAAGISYTSLSGAAVRSNQQGQD